MMGLLQLKLVAWLLAQAVLA
eukprot:COSAG05_NODE_7628_length_787_cov_1.434593_1_plen_20_part_10